MSEIVFQAWPKTPRLFRDAVISEKIDGTNAAIGIRPIGEPMDDPSAVYQVVGDHIIYAQSRNRVITPTSDNYGFASWVYLNADSLIDDLGYGLHFGEWWGRGINRGYGLDHRRFSLFNTFKWADKVFTTPQVDSVPVLATRTFSTSDVADVVRFLAEAGSVAAPGFKPAEGVVVYHTASKQVYKVLIENDHLPKSLAA